MFVTRLISGVVLVAIALVTIGLGNWVLFATLLLVSLIGARELYQAMKVSKKAFPCWSLEGTPVLSCIIWVWYFWRKSFIWRPFWQGL